MHGEFEVYLRRFAWAYEQQALASHALAARESRAKKGTGLVSCLRDVHDVYFAAKFNLGHTTTFEQVCPKYSVPASLVLQERLSHQLDLVERHLLGEIEARSGSFFDALGALHTLGAAVLRGRDQATRCRAKQAALAESLCGTSMRVRRLRRVRQHAAKVLRVLELVREVTEAADALPLLLQGGDYLSVHDLIGDIRSVMAREQLAGVAALRGIPERLTTAMATTDRAIASAVFAALADAPAERGAVVAAAVEAAAGELSTAGQKPPCLLERSARAATTSGVTVHLEEDAVTLRRAVLPPLLAGLMRSGRLAETLGMLRGKMSAETKTAIKATIAHVLPLLRMGVSADDEESIESAEECTSLAERLRALSPARFVALLSAVSATVDTLLKRAQAVHVAVETAYSASPAKQWQVKSGRLQQGDEMRRLQSDASVLLSGAGAESDASKEAMRECAMIATAIADAAEARWARLLGVRSAEHVTLPLAALAALSSAAQVFMARAEVARGRPCYSLRGTVQSQCTAWLNALSSNAEHKLAALLDTETWLPVPTPETLQIIAASLVEVHRGEADVGTQGDRICMYNRDGLADSASGVDGGDCGPSSVEIHYVPVGGERYHLVRAALTASQSVRALLDAATALPPLAPEVPYRVASLLRLFNTRSCRLVLGAGALQTAGLKSITAKHLALASQALTFFMTALHCMIAEARASLPLPRSGVAAAELERVVADMSKHQAEIHAKLLAIMRERLNLHVGRLPEVQARWAASKTAPRVDEPPSAFAASLVKEVGVLHRVLSPLLNEGELRTIFGRVTGALAKGAAVALSSASEMNPSPRFRAWMAADARALCACFSALPGAESKCVPLEELVVEDGN